MQEASHTVRCKATSPLQRPVLVTRMPESRNSPSLYHQVMCSFPFPNPVCSFPLPHASQVELFLTCGLVYILPLGTYSEPGQLTLWTKDQSPYHPLEAVEKCKFLALMGFLSQNTRINNLDFNSLQEILVPLEICK